MADNLQVTPGVGTTMRTKDVAGVQYPIYGQAALDDDEGYETYSNADLTTPGVAIKASKGKVYGWYLYNKSSTVKYVKLYAKASAPSPGSDTPKLRLAVPPNGGSNIAFGPGIPFPTGIAVIGVTGVADTDNTAPTANDLIVNIFWK